MDYRSLDRFKAPDTEPPAKAICVHCREGISAGDEIARIDDGGGFVHSDNCAKEYAMERIYDAIGVLGVNGTIY